MATVYSERSAATYDAAGSVAEAAGGIALIVLSIIGLGHVRPGLLAEIATIVLGAAFLAEGSAIMGEYARIVPSTGTTASVGGANGLMSEILIGAAVLVLGILAVIGIAPATLLPVAIIAAGALMLVSAPVMSQVAEVRRQSLGLTENATVLLRASSASAAGLQVLVGLAAVVLGILSLAGAGMAGGGAGALAGIAAGPTLVLVSLLILGAALTFNGTALTGSITRLFSR